MQTKTRIGIQIRHVRKSKGLTQDDLATLIERSTEAISNLERGVSMPSIETLERLSLKLGVPIKDFLDFSHEPKVSAKRAALLARLSGAALSLDDRLLSLAVTQVEAIRDSK